ncbi:hypothetical protein BaRGS_00016906 [Batillaria attramentaria]|uniref:Uncharacterized protein n=1 Tax=Batillaria attramentaria TaxID=370345 RepID=A0ABD0KXP3_9CAEN
MKACVQRPRCTDTTYHVTDLSQLLDMTLIRSGYRIGHGRLGRWREKNSVGMGLKRRQFLMGVVSCFLHLRCQNPPTSTKSCDQGI